MAEDGQDHTHVTSDTKHTAHTRSAFHRSGQKVKLGTDQAGLQLNGVSWEKAKKLAPLPHCLPRRRTLLVN